MKKIFDLELDAENCIKEKLPTYDQGDYVAGHCVHEAYDWFEVYQKHFETFIRLCREKKLNFDIIVNETYLDKPFRIPEYKPMIINFFALMTVYRIKHDGVKQNGEWNPNAKKFLFLTGKSDKLNRVGLLAELINLKLEEKMEWSFFPAVDNETYNRSLAYFSKFCDKNYKDFCLKYAHSPDNIVAEHINGGPHYSGFPFDVNLYKNTAFSVIPETDFQDNTCVWLTEKTYKTIVNKHPFIMAGQLGSIERLKKQGFKTFEKYLLDPTYHTIKDPEQRIKAIAKNAEQWIQNFNHIDQIYQDVEHNYNRLFELFDETIAKYKIFQNKLFYKNFFESTKY